MGLFLILIGLLVPLLIAACSEDDPTAVPQATPNFTSPPPVATPVPDQASVPDAVMEITDARMEISNQGTVGPHLVDGEGMSLYLFTNDERNVSNCSGGCAEAWPPLLTLENTLAGDGLDSERVSSIEREDGSSQDSGGVWFEVTTDGSAVYTNAPVNSTVNADLGSILTDAAGRRLYLYTRDEPNISNCSGGCALAWPSLITVADPMAGEGVSSPLLGTINRDDGLTQVTYNGDPLYYFAADEKPGDTLGQNRGDVWFVIPLAEQSEMTLGASKDDTLYETSGGEFNNGVGQ